MRVKGGRGNKYSWQTLLALGFICVLLVAALMQWLPWWLACYYLLCSVLTFVVYALDKRASIQGQWRTPEFRLQLFALLGGWPGALLAQQFLRHKSSKTSFLWLFGLMVLLNFAAFFWLMLADSVVPLRQLPG